MSKTKSFDIEITHFNTELSQKGLRPKNEDNCKELDFKTIKKKIKYDLIKTLEEEMESIDDLKEHEFVNKTPNFRYYYEEEGVHRFRTTFYYNSKQKSKDRQLLIKSLQKICENEVFRSTQFSIISKKLLKSLSVNEEKNTRFRILGINSFGFGTFIDLTHFVEHYNSCGVYDNETPINDYKNKLMVAKDDIIADFKLDNKKLDVLFRLTNGRQNGKHLKNIRHKLEIDFKSINSVIFSLSCVNKSMKIYVSLNHPPLLFKVAIDDLDENQSIKHYRETTYDRRRPPSKQKIYKTVEKCEGVHTYEIQNNEIFIRVKELEDCPMEVIGKCNVIVLDLPLIQDVDKARDKQKDKFDPFRLLYLIKRFSSTPIYFSFVEKHKCEEPNRISKTITSLSEKLRCGLKAQGINPFPIEYAFLSIFSFNFICFDELFLKKVFDEFIKSVIKYSEINSKTTEETLFELRALVDRNAIFCSLNALNKIFEDFKKRNEKYCEENIKLSIESNDCVFIRRCILTPTRFIMLPPQPTLASRFIINSEPEYTIRLSIREDDLQSLQYSIGNLKFDMNSNLKDMIKTPLKDGIEIGDRIYEFLGSSSSQLRDTGLILYAKDTKGKTAEKMKEEIGEFSDELMRNVPKYVARLGLAFSQVMAHIEVPKSQTKVDPDIERNGYTFTDGIGRVSIAIMDKVYKQRSMKRDCLHKPSAMQIRYGGCKGMLVVDPTLKGEQIIFRESMKKYESKNEFLGIIKLSSPRPLYLNRPFITILDQLGVKDRVLLGLLLDDLKLLSGSMICECRAIKILQSANYLGIPYRKVFNNGIPFLSEPFFRQTIDCLIKHRINELKLKGRVKLPMDMGRTVFGVIDETATLQYGEVFVQLSKVNEDNMPIGGKTDILEGEIMVTKFPCMHPGDVRKLKARDVKALHHIKDCIVFPQKGKRPHPDEMAGSDLDGDEYAVIWNSPLIFEGDNKEPMDFESSKPKLLEKKAELDHILDFYCDYIVNNNVGLLASAHLAKADTEKDGIFSDTCKSLAKKYAVALDFAKTGKTETISWKERPFLYPDFMEKFAHKRTQLSRKILGQMYRHCDRIGLGLDSGKKYVEITANPIERFRIEGYEDYIKFAKKNFIDYKENIENLLNRFGVESESILLSGTFNRTSKYMSGKNETNDINDLLGNIISKLFIKFRDLFKSVSENDSSEEKEKRISAWYLMPFIYEGSKDRYFGFSWIIADELCQLYKSKDVSKTQKSEHNCFEFAAHILDEFFEKNCLYCEPNVTEYHTISDKRQRIQEVICQTSELVIKAWFERQDHLTYKRLNKRKRLISSTDSAFSDMDRKLQRNLIKIRINTLVRAKSTDEPLISAGTLVFKFLKDSIDEWFSIETLHDNNRIVDTPLVKFGYSALITLNHFFKTREISHIISTNRKFQISLRASIRDEVFYISLPEKSKQTKDKTEFDIIKEKFTEFMVQYPEVFVDNLKKLTGIIEVYLDPRPLHTKALRFCYLMTVTGTVWSIQAVKNFISHPSFFQNVAKTQWKKRNLRYPKADYEQFPNQIIPKV